MDQFGFDRNTDKLSSLLPYHTEDEKAYSDKLDLILNAQINSTQLTKCDPAPSMLSGLIGFRDSYLLASHTTRPFNF
ncbi:hypothetical protein BLNAU_22531 [Blattamonas nauphoetae]|uniref:Uncharacterized protein n=1 Tax=Blattamonas nauphoetae TaxID=2049346 RepID=A0ABQ9WSR7_9EUKA|nr:hypothetical protein BLNAU_22531 [Blattamonas nauphoetae]